VAAAVTPSVHAVDATRDRGTASLVALAGAGGGIVMAAFDFSASWLWLPEPTARVLLGARLLGLLPALGALLATLLLLVDRSARPLLRRTRRPRRWAPLPLVALASPAIVALSIVLFQGGRMSRLPLRELWIALAALALALLFAVALRVARRLARVRHRRPFHRAVQAAALFALAFAASKADQTLYPRLYAGLHAVLALIGWSAASLAVWTVLPRPARWLDVRFVLPALLGALALTLASLPGDHDGRAVLFWPRNGTARSVMLGLAPALFALAESEVRDEDVERARQARRERLAGLSGGRLPRWDGAHVVIVTIDALRADHLGLYGHARPTSPHLDALGAEGVVFERAWTTTPRSSHALTSLMTGVAVHARLEAERPLPDATLADRLDAEGYYTAGFYPDGIFFHEGERFGSVRTRNLGFTRHDAENHDAESLTDAVLAELEDLRARREPPAFLWVHYFDVHEPYRDRYFGDAPVDRYDSEIRRVDRALARLHEGLSALEREVVLVITADHGEEHGDHGGVFHGGTLYEEQLRVPLIVVAPGLAPRRIAAPVSLADVAPTVLAMVGAPALDDAEGLDLRPALAGHRFDRGPIAATEEGLRAVLRWPYKLVEDTRVGGVELFDLSADPRERTSLADARPDLLRELAAELAALR
jgi:hypothetical protein